MLALFLLTSLAADAPADTSTAIDSDAVAAVVAAINDRCSASAATPYPWSGRLCGRTLFVDRESRQLVEAQMHRGTFKDGGLWPQNRPIANTSVEWRGHDWAMVQWPLTGDLKSQVALVLHESFHRIQSQLPFAAGDYVPAHHIDSLSGRQSLRKEMHYLAQAISAETVEDRRALADLALNRREHRLLDATSRRAERHLNLHEGLAEFAGVEAAYGNSMADRLIMQLGDAQGADSYVRSFAYFTGPAWAWLLDQELSGWISHLEGELDLADVYVNHVPRSEKRIAFDAAIEGRIEAEEAEREQRAADRVSALRTLFVEGNTLSLPAGSFRFDPNDADRSVITARFMGPFPRMRHGEVSSRWQERWLATTT